MHLANLLLVALSSFTMLFHSVIFPDHFLSTVPHIQCNQLFEPFNGFLDICTPIKVNVSFDIVFLGSFSLTYLSRGKNLLSIAFVNVYILLPHILCWPRSLTGECYSILKCTLVITHEMIVTCTLQVTCVKWFSKARGQVEGEHVNKDFRNSEKKKTYLTVCKHYLRVGDI